MHFEREREKKNLFQLFPGSLSTLPQLNQLTIEKYYNLYSKNVHYIAQWDFWTQSLSQIYKCYTEFELRDSSRDNRGLTRRKLANQICIFASLKARPCHLWGAGWMMEWKKVWSKMPVCFVERNFESFFLFFSTLFGKDLNGGWRTFDAEQTVYFFICCKFSWSICLQGLFWRLRHSNMIQILCWCALDFWNL